MFKQHEHRLHPVAPAPASDDSSTAHSASVGSADRSIDEPWIPHPDARPIVDRWAMNDIDLLTEVTHPVRGAVLRRVRTPRSVAEIADLMDVPVTRLYHHVNKLAAAGLIQVVATRQVGAVTERRYQTVAEHYSIDDELLESADRRELGTALGSIFDLAKLGLQRTVEAGELNGDDGRPPRGSLSIAERHLSPAALAELLEQLESLLERSDADLSDDDPDAIRVTLFVSAYPTVD